MPDGRMLIPRTHVASPERVGDGTSAPLDRLATATDSLRWRDADGTRWVTSYTYVIGQASRSKRLAAKLRLALRIPNSTGIAGVLGATQRCATSCDSELRQNQLLLGELRKRLE